MAEKAKEPTVKKMESNPKPEEKDVVLSDIDPADGSQEVRNNSGKQGILDGTTADQLPEGAVDEAYAASIKAKRAWEAEQGKLAEVPDPDVKKD
jgi:hypothetical protein